MPAPGQSLRDDGAARLVGRPGTGLGHSAHAGTFSDPDVDGRVGVVVRPLAGIGPRRKLVHPIARVGGSLSWVSSGGP